MVVGGLLCQGEEAKEERREEEKWGEREGVFCNLITDMTTHPFGFSHWPEGHREALSTLPEEGFTQGHEHQRWGLLETILEVSLPQTFPVFSYFSRRNTCSF